LIINFSIENFKVFKDRVTLSFLPSSMPDLEKYYVVPPIPEYPKLKLLKLAIVYGPNASGKTTIIDALSFIKDLINFPFNNKDQKFIELKPFLGDEISAMNSTKFEIEFVNGNVRFSYFIELNKNAIISEILKFKEITEGISKQRYSTAFKRETDLERKLTRISFSPKLRLKQADKGSLENNTLWNNTVLGGYHKTNVSVDILEKATDWFKNKLMVLYPKFSMRTFITRAVDEGKINLEKMLKLLKKADFEIENVTIKEQELDPRAQKFFKTIKEAIAKEVSKEVGDDFDEDFLATTDQLKEPFFEHRTLNTSFELPYSEESAGTLKYYELCGLLSIMMDQSKVVAIDELESSLHPDLIEHFIKTFLVNVENSQLIATTHYRELLKNRDILRYDAVWFTERKKGEGYAELFSLSDFNSSILRRRISSIYNAYRIGKLGAVPKLDQELVIE